MITAEELAKLRNRYDSSPTKPTCGLCGGPMKISTTAGEKIIYACYESTATKYSRDWWEHVEQSKTFKSGRGDSLVMKLIEAYEGMIGG